MSQVLPGIRDALEGMNRGDVESAVSLLDPEVEWRGPTRGYVWWRHAPRCHGPDQAGENFELQVTKGNRRPGAAAFTLEQAEQIGAARVTSAHHSEEECPQATACAGEGHS